MIGDNYWSTGLILKYGSDGWCAIVKFYDGGFCQDESTEGKMYTRYFVPLDVAIDTILKGARRLGIVFNGTQVMAYQDGYSEEWPMPDGWRDALREQAQRIGWGFDYAERTEASAE